MTRYLLDGDEEIAELDGSNNVLRRFVTASAVDDRIADVEGSSTSPTLANHTFYHVNHQGSVIAMTDATGNVTGCAPGTNCQRLSYDEYGNLTSAATTTGQPYRYTGRRYDPETGLYYYRARYYSPQLGRFLQTDPVGYKDDVDLYTYVGNDPLDRVDPSGNSILEIGFLVDDVVELGAAISSGEDLGTAIANVAIDVLAVASPVPGISEAAHAVEGVAKAEKAAKGTENVASRVEKTASGKRAGDFTRAQRKAAKAKNAEKNQDKMACTDCGKEVKNVKSEKGVPTPDNQAQVHHDPAIKDGGGRHSEAVVLCPHCHEKRHTALE